MICINEADFLEYLRARHYSPKYNQFTLNFIRKELQDVTNEDVRLPEDLTPIVENILSCRYNSRNSMCAMRISALRKLQDYLRKEATA